VNLFEPWILLRLLAGLTAVCLFARGAATSRRLIRHFDVTRATEGQLAIERQMELATTFLRVGAIAQVGALALTVLAADRLSHSVRGAMCAYGVFQANRWGFLSLGVTAFVAFAAAVTSQLCAFDRRLRGLAVVRPIAMASLFMAPLALADFACTAAFLLRLDLGAVASCCSVQLDVGISSGSSFASGSRTLALWGAAFSVSLSAIVAWAASVRPRSFVTVLASGCSLLAVPFALDAAVLEVAPHAFELPQHACPFCLLHADVLWMGYPLFGSIFLASVWSVGAAVSCVAARGRDVADALSVFSRTRLRRGAAAWLVAFAVGTAPILQHALVSGGKPLFP
jgi:hypothetical protein